MKSYSFSELLRDMKKRLGYPYRRLRFLFSDSGCISYMCLRNWEMGTSEPQELLKELLLDRLESYDDIADLVRYYKEVNGYAYYGLTDKEG